MRTNERDECSKTCATVGSGHSCGCLVEEGSEESKHANHHKQQGWPEASASRVYVHPSTR
jgi:hypothetical protein